MNPLLKYLPLTFPLFLIAGVPVASLGQQNKAIELTKYARILYGRGQYDSAILYCNQAISISKKNEWAFLIRGRSYNDEENHDQAIEDFNQSIALNPNYDSAYNYRGNAYYDKANYDQAFIDYSKAIELNPKFSNAYSNRGRIYKLRNQPDSAISAYNMAIELNPKNALAYNNRGNTYKYMGKYDQAFSDFKKAIELDPKYGMAYLNRGDLYEQLGKYDQAIEDYNRGLDFSPNDKDAYDSRGFAYSQKGNNDQAIIDFRKALQLDSNDPNIYNNLGNAYYNKGDYELAIQNYRACLTIEPLNKFALLNILPSLIRLTRFDEAHSIYVKYKASKINGYIENDVWKYLKSYLDIATDYVRNGRYKDALEGLKTAEVDYANNTEIKKGMLAVDRKRYSDVLALKGYILEKLKLTNDAEDAYNQALLIKDEQPDVKEGLIRLKNIETSAKNTQNDAPSIELINPIPSSTLNALSDNHTIQIIGRAKGVSGIARIIINGRAAKNLEDDGLFIDTIQVVNGVNTIKVTATDKMGTSSNRSFSFSCTVMGSSAESPNIPVFKNEPKYYAILIAEQNYTDPAIPSLNKPIADALKLKKIIETKYTFSAANDDTLFNRTKEDIMGAIIQKCNTLTDNDNLLIFYAGHGTAEKDQYGDIDGYLVPCSAKKGNYSTYITANDIIIALKRSRSRHILLVADACFSGALTREILPDAPKYIQAAYTNKSRSVMASGNLEPVPDNSIFMYYLMKKLDENKEKYLIADKLFDSLKNMVSSNSDSRPQYGPITKTGDEGGDFLFIKK